ncbi:MAG: hypothetical protein JSV88_25365 [Candidatus Aminicenantes bacterium]|nr:MAG: hypothetical protein JSV88_25365 [Candidatus Aminicenantes bacterium]
MMKNEELESNLIKIFSQFTRRKKDYLVEKIQDNRLTIQETEERGRCEVSFKNGPFIRLSEKMLGTNKFINFFNQQEGAIIRRICDGIFLVPLEGRIILCLVELKINIKYNNFSDAVKQIEGSYLKTAMLLSLLCKIEDMELAIFIGGRIERVIDDPDIDYLEKTEEFRENPQNLESKLKEFFHKRKFRMNFPFFLAETIHENYHKKNVSVYHLAYGDTFDMQAF